MPDPGLGLRRIPAVQQAGNIGFEHRGGKFVQQPGRRLAGLRKMGHIIKGNLHRRHAEKVIGRLEQQRRRILPEYQQARGMHRR